MPVARFEMPDGRVARFEVADGTTPEQAQALIESQIAQMTQPEQPQAQPQQPEPSFYDKMRGAAGDARAVAGELAGVGNRAIFDTVDFFTTDPANAILRMAGSDKQVPAVSEILGSLTMHTMPPGTARDVVEGLGANIPAAAGFAQVPRNLATLPGAASEFLGIGTAKPGATATTPLIGKVQEYIGAGPYVSPVDEKLALLRGEGDVAGFGKKLDAAGNVVKDATQTAAEWQGFDPGFVSYIQSAGPDTRKNMTAMVDVVEQRQKNWRGGLDARPLNILGNSIDNRIKVVREANRVAAVRLDDVADGLKGAQVDVSPAVNSFLGELEGMGVKFDPKSSTVSFQGSDLEGVPGPQRVIRNVLNRMPNTQVSDAYDVHRLKKFIDEQVSYGKNARGLSGKTEGLLKTLRHDIDGVLDTNFEAYNKVNTQYSETRQKLDDIADITGKKFDPYSPTADLTLGNLGRRFLSNAQSNGRLRDAVEGLDSIARKYITPGTDLVPYKPIQARSGVTPAMLENDDLIGLAGFANELDKMFGPSSGTSLFGDVDKAVQRGAETMTGNMTAAGMLKDGAAWAGKKAMGKNEQRAMKAMRELLKKGEK